MSNGTPRILNVLVVDDAKVVADVLAQIIEVLGHKPTVAHSGKEAVATISRDGGHFDIIFSDISMPDMDGHALAEQLTGLRKEGQLRAKLIVAMSGYGDPEERDRAKRSGFDRHILKPPEFTDLEQLFDEVARM